MEYPFTIQMSFWEFSGGQDMMNSQLTSGGVEAVLKDLSARFSGEVSAESISNHGNLAIMLVDIKLSEKDENYLHDLSEKFPEIMFEERLYQGSEELGKRNAVEGFVGQADYDLDTGWDLTALVNSQGVPRASVPVYEGEGRPPSAG